MYEVQSLVYDSPLVVEDWFSVVVAPKLCSGFLLLPELVELPKHVKRVKKQNDVCSVLVAPASGADVINRVLAHTGFQEQKPELQKIPLTPPVKKEQLAQYNAMWPCQFYEVIPDTALLTPDLKIEFEKYMRMALDAAKDEDGQAARGLQRSER